MKTNLRDEINKLRKKYKISISKLAKLADTDYGTTWKFLGGTKRRTQMKANSLEKIYDAFRKLEQRAPKKNWEFPTENFTDNKKKLE